MYASSPQAARRGSRLVVIENGVDTSHFRPRKTRREAQDALGIRIGAPTFGTVTRLRPQKGCDVLLRAVARVFEEIPVCNCVFVGEGPLDARLRRLARRLGVAERMLWRDHTEDPREIYEALDLFVMSSRYEGMPYAMLEAMSMGLPVVATRVCGCQDVVKEGVTGLLVAPDRPDELAQEILRLLRDPERAQRMGAAAREAVERELPRARFLDRTADLYADVCKEGKEKGERVETAPFPSSPLPLPPSQFKALSTLANAAFKLDASG